MINFFKGLGIGLLCILCFVAGVIFNVQFLKSQNTPKNSAFSFTSNIEVFNKLRPQTFSSSPNFTASNTLSNKESLSSEDKVALTNNFNAVLEKVKQSKICTGGSYSVEPTFLYKDGVQIIKGQRFFASLDCEFKENELGTYNALMNEVDKISKQGGFFSVNLPALNAVFTDKELLENDKILQNLLIKEALNNAQNYSKDINKTCALKSLSPENARIVPVLRSNLMSAKADFSSSLPATNEQAQKMSALAQYECF